MKPRKPEWRDLPTLLVIGLKMAANLGQLAFAHAKAVGASEPDLAVMRSHTSRVWSLYEKLVDFDVDFDG